MVTTWLVMLQGLPADPMLPFYATVGLGGLAGTILYLRSVDRDGTASAALAAERGAVAVRQLPPASRP